MNILSFTGNVGNDAEVRYTSDSKPIASWSVALRSGFGKSEKTTWVRCSMFGERSVKLAEFIKKGTLIGVVGEASLNEYVNKAGENKASLECNVSNVTLLGKKDSADNKPAEHPAKTDDELESNIPF